MFQSDSSEFLHSVPFDEELRSLSRELAESRRQFESVLRSLAGLFYRCELTPPWRMSFVSDGLEALTGYTTQELELREGWATLMSAEDKASVEDEVSRAITEKRPFELIYRIQCKSGEVRWVSERGHAVYGTGGEAQFLEGTIRDVSGRKEADELQKDLLSRWRKVLDTIPQMVWTVSADGTEEFYNAQWISFTGCHVGSSEAIDRASLVHPEDRSRALATWKRCFKSGEPYEAQYRLKHADDGYRWVLSRGQLEQDARGQPLRWYGTCTDVHEKVLVRQALEGTEAINRSIVESTPDCMSLVDLNGVVQFANRAALEALSTPRSNLVGRPWGELFPPSTRGPALIALSQARAGRSGRFTTSQPAADGQRWWDVVVTPITSDQGATTGILAVARDITHQKTAEERVRWAANHDALTQLPNRALFQRTLDRALSEARETGGSLTVLMMDLDDFKRTNDALGHDAGDAVLVDFATRLRLALRADDVVARLGGDEFAVLLQGVSADKEVKAAVDSILTAMKLPCSFDGKLLDLKTSVGACSFPEQGSTRGELLKHADIALYVAKGAGRGVLRIFEPSMRAEAQNRISMLSLAKEALDHDWIRPFYQPKVDLRTGRIDGFEALLRWEHPGVGIQAPDTIAAAFQDVPLAAQISDRIIELVIRDMRRWTDEGIPFDHVAVNAAAAEFRRGAFAEKLLEALERASLPSSAFQLEVTETVFLGRGAEHVQEALQALSAEGIQIALDDFGTGYASLSHLNHFPVNVIKIDRSFVSRLETSEHDAAIVRAVINLGRSLGIKIVAEGVETETQRNFLRRHRCHSAQGYLYSAAAPASAVPGLVTEWSRRAAKL